MASTRRLAAILAADVAGYSRPIGADEKGTPFDPKIAAHHDRLVKTTGDGFLIEFSSAVDALRSATQVEAQCSKVKRAGRTAIPTRTPSAPRRPVALLLNIMLLRAVPRH